MPGICGPLISFDFLLVSVNDSPISPDKFTTLLIKADKRHSMHTQKQQNLQICASKISINENEFSSFISLMLVLAVTQTKTVT